MPGKFGCLLLTVALLAACSPGPIEKPGRSFYTDREVETFIERYPSLVGPIDGDPAPEEIIQQLEIDLAALHVIDHYMGNCVNLTIYELSPSYDLVVDDNPCSGYRVQMRENESPPGSKVQSQSMLLGFSPAGWGDRRTLSVHTAEIF